VVVALAVILLGGVGISQKQEISFFGLQRFLLDPPCIDAAFVVNSEPHTGARPSVRLCSSAGEL
jgi:hypothetical protein